MTDALGKSETLELYGDANYFLGEAIKRIERLQKLEPSGARRPQWQQAAALTRRVRAHVRHQADEHRRRSRQLGARP